MVVLDNSIVAAVMEAVISSLHSRELFLENIEVTRRNHSSAEFAFYLINQRLVRRAPQQLVIQDKQFRLNLRRQTPQLRGRGVILRAVFLPSRLFLRKAFFTLHLMNEHIGTL